MKQPPPDSLAVDLANWATQLRKGGLDLAVLASLWPGRLYGLEILRRLAGEGGMSVPEGTIYPLLNRLRNGGLVSAEWVESDAGHPRKYYQLTAVGRRQVAAMAAAWRAFAAGVDHLLSPLAEAAE